MISGIICEFNPFHAGHKHLIDQVKCHPGDAVVCVMSGNFVQRGTFAVYDKRARTEAALKGGADLVLELPTAYATRSAEGFARAGVQLLEATGVVERLAFGTECADLQALTALAGEIKAHQGEIAQVC